MVPIARQHPRCVTSDGTHEPKTAMHTENGWHISSFYPFLVVARQGRAMIWPSWNFGAHMNRKFLPLPTPSGHNRACVVYGLGTIDVDAW
jgi:hypothetical protein